MKICIPKEAHPGENRVPMVPDNVAKLAKRGAQIEIEAGMGLTSGHADSAFINQAFCPVEIAIEAGKVKISLPTKLRTIVAGK